MKYTFRFYSKTTGTTLFRSEVYVDPMPLPGFARKCLNPK